MQLPVSSRTTVKVNWECARGGGARPTNQLENPGNPKLVGRDKLVGPPPPALLQNSHFPNLTTHSAPFLRISWKFHRNCHSQIHPFSQGFIRVFEKHCPKSHPGSAKRVKNVRFYKGFCDFAFHLKHINSLRFYKVS